MNKIAKFSEVPKLKIDAGRELREVNKIDRRVVYSLLKTLEAAGHKLVKVDREDWLVTSDIKEAMERIHDLDDAVIVVTAGPGFEGEHAIWAVNGEDGWDVIADWNFFSDDRDGFSALMDGFLELTMAEYDKARDRKLYGR